MRIEAGLGGCTLYRESGDRRISHESTVTHHMRRLLNERDGGGWTRFYPDRVGLTSCRQGVQNKKLGIMYWHERYAIEDAAQEFNKFGKIYYMAA
jgi:hypothetical protein